MNSVELCGARQSLMELSGAFGARRSLADLAGVLTRSVEPTEFKRARQSGTIDLSKNAHFRAKNLILVNCFFKKPPFNYKISKSFCFCSS